MFSNTGTGVFNNYNSIINTVIFENDGILENYGSFNNNSGNAFNYLYSTINNYAGSIITNNYSSEIVNNGTITNITLGKIFNCNGSTITNNGTFTNSGVINNPTVDAGCGIGTLNGSSPITATNSTCPL